MDLERQTLRRQLVTFLYQANPKLTLALKNTPQVCPGWLSDFHMEDSVWTHTMLVLQSALDQKDFCLEDIATALVHDFAKPLAARVKPAKKGPGKRMSFAGHGPLGTQSAVDFCLAARKAGLLPLANEDIARVAAATSNHIAFYGLADASLALPFCNNDARLCRTLTRLLYCDMQGSIADTMNPSLLNNLELLAGTRQILKDQAISCGQEGDVTSGPGLHLVCGLPSPAKKRLAQDLARGRRIVTQASPKPRKDPSGASPDGSGAGSMDNLPDNAPACPGVAADGNGEAHSALVQQLVFLEPALRDEGVLFCAGLCTRSQRRELYSLLAQALPGIPVTCTFVLSPLHSWPPSPSCDLAHGLPRPCPELVMPSLLFEPFLDKARVLLADGE